MGRETLATSDSKEKMWQHMAGAGVTGEREFKALAVSIQNIISPSGLGENIILVSVTPDSPSQDIQICSAAEDLLWKPVAGSLLCPNVCYFLLLVVEVSCYC